MLPSAHAVCAAARSPSTHSSSSAKWAATKGKSSFRAVRKKPLAPRPLSCHRLPSLGSALSAHRCREGEGLADHGGRVLLDCGGSGEMGMVFGGRSRYAVPGIDGKPGVRVVAVTRTAGVTVTWSRWSRPRAGAFQKVNVQVVL